MSKSERIGVYGGTFDPIHKTHLDIARAALDQGHLDKVLFVVAAIAPHKKHEGYASPEDRLAMVRIAIEGEPGFEASDIELRREGLSYTIDTLRELQAQWPQAQLVLILGQDSLVDLPQWRESAEILKMAEVLSAPRGGMDAGSPTDLQGKYTTLVLPAQSTSSTEIRERIAEGEAFEDLCPRGVAEYIKQKGLYSYGHHGKPDLSKAH